MSLSRNMIGHGGHGFRGRLGPKGSESGRSDADSARNSRKSSSCAHFPRFDFAVWIVCFPCLSSSLTVGRR